MKYSYIYIYIWAALEHIILNASSFIFFAKEKKRKETFSFIQCYINVRRQLHEFLNVFYHLYMVEHH